MKYIIQTSMVAILFISISCHQSRGIALDPQSKSFYEKARLIMTKEEKDIFNHLPDIESRQEFIKDFWAKRDPDPDTEENEFKDEFFRRIEYANKHFKEGIPGWKTDRGRIYIYLGPPDRVEERPFLNYPGAKGLIWWSYYKYRLAVEFIDTRGDGSYDINRHYGGLGNLLWVIDKAKFGQIFIQADAVFIDFDLLFDRNQKKILIEVPVTNLSFNSKEGLLKADFEFNFFIYTKNGLKKDVFTQNKSLNMPEEKVLELKMIKFEFPYDIEPGQYFFDVIITIKPSLGKTRKIFKVKA